jgi:hypothetical protein
MEVVLLSNRASGVPIFFNNGDGCSVGFMILIIFEIYPMRGKIYLITDGYR